MPEVFTLREWESMSESEKNSVTCAIILKNDAAKDIPTKDLVRQMCKDLEM